MTSALELLGLTDRVEHHPDPEANNSPTRRFYVGILQDGVEVVGPRKSIILVVGKNNIFLTWTKATECQPTHAAMYEHPVGGGPFISGIGREAVGEINEVSLIHSGSKVTLTWQITWLG